MTKAAEREASETEDAAPEAEDVAPETSGDEASTTPTEASEPVEVDRLEVARARVAESNGKDQTAVAYASAAEIVGGSERLPETWHAALDQPDSVDRALLPNPLRMAFPGGEYRWGFPERDADGKKLHGADKLRIAIAGKPRKFFELLDLAPSWSMVDRRWFGVVPIEEGERVAAGLAAAGQQLFAAALRLCLPLWEARAKAEAQETAEKREAAEKARRAEAKALKIEVSKLDEVHELAAAAQRLGPPEKRKDPDYLQACVEAVGRLIKSERWPPTEKRLRDKTIDSTGLRGAWRVFEEKGEEMIAVHAGKGKPTWHKGADLPKATYRDFGSKTYLVYKVRYALQISRLLDDVSLDLALSIRLGLCYEPLESYHAELEIMAGAKAVEDIPRFDLQERVRAIVDEIPFPAGLEPRAHQEVAIAYCVLANYRALIGDAMGLGKTIEAIGVLSHGWRKLLPAVVVCPTSVVGNWANEIRKWAPWFTPEVVGSGAPPPPDERTIYVVGWDSLAKHVEALQLRGVNCAIFDESHFAKNSKAQRSRAAAALAETTPGVLLLSGTAMENTSAELWHQLHMLDPVEFPDLVDFRARYAQLSKRSVRGRELVDSEDGENLEELGHRLRGYMVRRLKTEVLEDLPDKTRELLWVRLPKGKPGAPGPAELYQEAKAKIHLWLEAKHRSRMRKIAARAFVRRMKEATGLPSGWGSEHRPAIRAALVQSCEEASHAPPSKKIAQMAIVKLNTLRSIVGQAKVGQAIAWINDFREASNNASLVVFAKHKAVINQLTNQLTKHKIPWTAITGSTSSKPRKNGLSARDEAVAAFQAGKAQVIVCSQAATTGVTLTAASDVLFLERWWVPAQEEQAEDRTHRIGQKSAVVVHYLMAKGTVDEDIARLVDAKRGAVGRVLGAEDVTEHETETVIGGDVAESVAQGVVRSLVGGLDRSGDAQLTPQTLLRYLRKKQIL